MDNLAQVFVRTYVFSSLGYIPRVELPDHMQVITPCLTFWGTARWFPKVTVPFHIPTSSYESSRFSTFLLTLLSWCFLTLGHFGIHRMIQGNHSQHSSCPVWDRQTWPNTEVITTISWTRCFTTIKHCSKYLIYNNSPISSLILIQLYEECTLLPPLSPFDR